MFFICYFNQIIQPFIDWICNNILTILAIAAASIFSVWQIKETFKEQKRQALAEQRYLILLAMYRTRGYYNVVIQLPDSERDTYLRTIQPEFGELHNTILQLLVRPTSMPYEERYRIYRANAPLDLKSMPFNVLISRISEMVEELEHKLNPDITRFLTTISEENSQAIEYSQNRNNQTAR